MKNRSIIEGIEFRVNFRLARALVPRYETFITKKSSHKDLQEVCCRGYEFFMIFRLDFLLEGNFEILFCDTESIFGYRFEKTLIGLNLSKHSGSKPPKNTYNLMKA